MNYDVRAALRKRFPYFISIVSEELSEELFAFCEEELDLIFKIDFDVRNSNGVLGKDFYFRDQEPYIAAKTKYS